MTEERKGPTHGWALTELLVVISLIERGRTERLAEWARHAKGVLGADPQASPRCALAPFMIDAREPDYLPGRRPPEGRLVGLPKKKTCLGCKGDAREKNFSGHYYCVTCSQLGYNHGWCFCLSPVYRGGACKRGGRRCKQRGKPPSDKKESA